MAKRSTAKPSDEEGASIGALQKKVLDTLDNQSSINIQMNFWFDEMMKHYEANYSIYRLLRFLRKYPGRGGAFGHRGQVGHIAADGDQHGRRPAEKEAGPAFAASRGQAADLRDAHRGGGRPRGEADGRNDHGAEPRNC